MLVFQVMLSKINEQQRIMLFFITGNCFKTKEKATKTYNRNIIMELKIMQNRPKYNAKKTIIGNLKFDSKKETEYYLKLKAKVALMREINWIKLQPEFLILRGFTLENGERTKGIRYVADFEVEHADGHKK